MANNSINATATTRNLWHVWTDTLEFDCVKFSECLYVGCHRKSKELYLLDPKTQEQLDLTITDVQLGWSGNETYHDIVRVWAEGFNYPLFMALAGPDDKRRYFEYSDLEKHWYDEGTKLYENIKTYCL